MTIDIRRDEWGIPHLRADSELELSYAQGYNAAIDRGWQLEVERHRMLGTSAAFLGAESLEWDRFARRAFLEDTARLCFRELEQSTRDWVRAYVAGVNAGLAKTRAPEFAASNLVPGHWAAWTPLGIWLSTHSLLGGFPSKLWRDEVSRHLGDKFLNLFSTDGKHGAGSNGWLVPGHRTDTQHPILAGDPHRFIEEPGVYQQIQLVCPDYDVVGFAVPGVPGIAHFGQAESVAWCITNAMADCQDLFQEKLRRHNGEVEALGPDGYYPVQTYRETIEVLGSEDTEVELIETDRGLVIMGGPDEDVAISLCHPPRECKNLGFDALPRLLRARSVEDINQAFDKWVEPVNVVQAADTTGNTLYRVAGAVPIRHHENAIRAVPAWEVQYAWKGFHETLPSRAVEDITVMANQRDLAEPFGVEFSQPHRAQRIAQLLATQPQWTAKDMAAIHMDTFLPSAQPVLNLLMQLSDLSEAATNLRDRLLNWDCHMRGDCQDAALYATVRAAMVCELATLPVFKPLSALVDGSAPYPHLFYPWLDLTARIGFALENLITANDLNIDCAAILGKVLENIACNGVPETGWADLHRLVPWQALPHEIPGGWPGLGGDHDCVLSTYSVPGVTHNSIRGPAARYVWDLANRENSLWVVPLGASGLRDSPYHHNQLPLWLRGELVPVVTAHEQLTLENTLMMTEPGSPVYEYHIPAFGNFSLVPVQPEKDLDLIYRWVKEERAKYWGMGEYDKDYVLEIYDYLDSLATHQAYLVFHEATPAALFQTYQPEADPVAACYEVEAGDMGLHLMMAPPEEIRKGYTAAILSALLDYLFMNPAVTRVIAEPDVRNEKMITRLSKSGFTAEKDIELLQKRARLMFLSRERHQ